MSGGSLEPLLFNGKGPIFTIFYAKELQFGEKLKKGKRIQWDSNSQRYDDHMDLTALPIELLRQIDKRVIIYLTYAA